MQQKLTDTSTLKISQFNEDARRYKTILPRVTLFSIRVTINLITSGRNLIKSGYSKRGIYWFTEPSCRSLREQLKLLDDWGHQCELYLTYLFFQIQSS